MKESSGTDGLDELDGPGLLTADAVQVSGASVSPLVKLGWWPT